MIIGRRLLAEAGLSCADEIDHRTIDSLLSLYEEKKDSFYQEAAQAIQSALNACYGNREISLQQLSATFRRGFFLPSFPNPNCRIRQRFLHGAAAVLCSEGENTSVDSVKRD